MALKECKCATECKGCCPLGAESPHTYDACKDCRPDLGDCVDGDTAGVVFLCDGCPECDGCEFDCHENERAHPDCKEHSRAA